MLKNVLIATRTVFVFLASGASMAFALSGETATATDIGQEFAGLPREAQLRAVLKKDKQRPSEADCDAGKDTELVAFDMTVQPPRAPLASGDKLIIKVNGYADLTGEYRVRSDGSIMMPGIGRICVANSDAVELETLLASRLSQMAERATYVSVEVLEYRPVYVAGEVNKPSAYPWQPGLTVLQAVTIAGGFFRQGAEALQSNEGFTKKKRLIEDLKFAMASVVRLQAEREGRTTLTAPPEFISRFGQDGAQRALAVHKDPLKTRRQLRDVKLAGFQTAEKNLENEIKALTEQGERINQQLKLRSAIREDLRSLKQRGLTRSDRVMEEESKIAELEDKSMTNLVTLTRTRSALVNTQLERSTKDAEWQLAIDEEVAKLNRQIALLEAELADVDSLSLNASGPGTRVAQFEIVRRVKGEMKAFKADPLSMIQAGDIITVGAR